MYAHRLLPVVAFFAAAPTPVTGRYFYFNATRLVALRPVKLNAKDLFAHGLSPFETSGPESFMAGGVLSLTLRFSLKAPQGRINPDSL